VEQASLGIAQAGQLCTYRSEQGVSSVGRGGVCQLSGVQSVCVVARAPVMSSSAPPSRVIVSPWAAFELPTPSALAVTACGDLSVVVALTISWGGEAANAALAVATVALRAAFIEYLRARSASAAALAGGPLLFSAVWHAQRRHAVRVAGASAKLRSRGGAGGPAQRGAAHRHSASWVRTAWPANRTHMSQMDAARSAGTQHRAREAPQFSTMLTILTGVDTPAEGAAGVATGMLAAPAYL
jgi:hypothetical protein